MNDRELVRRWRALFDESPYHSPLTHLAERIATRLCNSETARTGYRQGLAVEARCLRRLRTACESAPIVTVDGVPHVPAAYLNEPLDIMKT